MKITDLYLVDNDWEFETIVEVSAIGDYKIIYRGVYKNMPFWIKESIVFWFCRSNGEYVININVRKEV